VPDPEAGCRFTAGTWWIKQFDRRASLHTVKSIRPCARVHEREMMPSGRTVANELRYMLGRMPTVEEVALSLRS
jgi:DNA-directed RNA polymerase sigma subunit (sigma70/sigma32)